jgi:hypothetical protein
MKKILMLAAASLLAFGGTAIAKTKSYVISLSAPLACVVANINVTGTQVAANENDDCQQFIGGGLIGKVKRSGKQAVIGGFSNLIPGAELVISLDYPFVSGGNYTVYGTSDGVTLNKVGSGTYSVQ